MNAYNLPDYAPALRTLEDTKRSERLIAKSQSSLAQQAGHATRHLIMRP